MVGLSMLTLHTAVDVQFELKDHLKAARKAKKWSVAYLSERSGVPNSTLRKFESTGNISLRQFLMLCEALGKLDDVLTMIQPLVQLPTSIDDVLQNN